MECPDKRPGNQFATALLKCWSMEYASELAQLVSQQVCKQLSGGKKRKYVNMLIWHVMILYIKHSNVNDFKSVSIEMQRTSLQWIISWVTLIGCIKYARNKKTLAVSSIPWYLHTPPTPPILKITHTKNHPYEKSWKFQGVRGSYKHPLERKFWGVWGSQKKIPS